ncbi:hypothetical protein [Gymnodinialimonas sp.]
MMNVRLSALALVAVLLPAPIAAQTSMVEYTAFIGEQDLYSSVGVRLTFPWQVLRQDRANYHRFGLRQPGDEWDPIFDDFEARGRMEAALQRGYISSEASDDIMRGGSTVIVRVFEGGQRVEVDVLP